MYSIHWQHDTATGVDSTDICCRDSAIRTACKDTERDGIERIVKNEKGTEVFDTTKDDWPEELLTSRNPKKENVK